MDFSKITSANGIVLMFVGMGVTFLALLILMTMMLLFKDAMHLLHKRNQIFASLRKGEAAIPAVPEPESMLAAQIAAIAATLFIEDEAAHDEESLVLTMRALPKPYSNWWMPGIYSYNSRKSQAFRPTKNPAAEKFTSN